MIRRPKRQENEDDLLQFQEQFMLKQSPPAAKVVKMKPEPDGRKRDVVSLDEKETQDQQRQRSPLKKSKFKERLEAQFQAERKEQSENLDASEILDRHDHHITTVLSKIKERDTTVPSYIQQSRFVGGFPVAPHIKKDFDSQERVKGEKKQSLFAKQFRRQSPSLFGMLEQAPKSILLKKSSKEQGFEEKNVEMTDRSISSAMSGIITGDGLGQYFREDETERIHQENMARLAELPQEEILEEQAKLTSSIDPKILAFIKSKRSKTFEAKMATRDTQIEKKEVEERIEDDQKHVSSQENGERQEDSQFDPYEHFKIEKELPGMEIIEDEKLQWMKDPPKPLLKNGKDQSGLAARFDLDGNLASKTNEVDFNRALHHHGEDPDAPGYTLEELFHLARCNFKQQRVFALQLLARILEEYHKGSFRDHLQTCLLKQLIDAGLPFLLRWSLDDNTEAIFSAAMYTLSAMLTVPCDNHAVDSLMYLDRGLEIPALKPDISEMKSMRIDRNEARDLTDPEMMEIDVIKGLIQVQILPRLRYIFEVCKPSEKTVNNCMAILTRIVLHSSESAYEVMKCPRLVLTICSNFLPLTWNEDKANGGCAPLTSAARLVRMLSLSGKSIASKLWTDFDVCSSVLRYVSLLTQDECSDDSLIIESLHIWRICLSYGIGISTARDVYPLLISLLQKFGPQSSVGTSSILKALLLLCESIVQATSIKTDDSSKDLAAPATPIETDDSSMDSAAERKKSVRFSGVASETDIDLIEWKMVEGIHSIILQLMKEHVRDFISDDNLSDRRFDVLSCLLLYLSAYIDNAKFQKSLRKIDLLLEIESLMKDFVMKLINSEKCHQFLSDLRVYSDLIKTPESLHHVESVSNLPSYGMAIFKDGPSCLQSQSPFTLVSSVTKLLVSITTFHKGCPETAFDYVSSEPVLAYLNAFSASHASAKVSSTAITSSIERNLLYSLIHLFKNVVQDFIGSHRFVQTYHLASLKLFSSLQNGEEFQSKQLLCGVILEGGYFSEISEVGDMKKLTTHLGHLKLSASSRIHKEICSSVSRLLNLALDKLLHIRKTFFTVCFRKLEKAIVRSKTRFYRDRSKLETLFIPSKSGTLLPIDWVFLPIIELYSMATNVELSGEVISQLSADAINTIEMTLLFILLLEFLRPEFFNSISPAIRLVRLLCVFLIGNDAFLESPVYKLLQEFLHLYTTDEVLECLDFEMKFPGISSFYDMYSSLLVQFSASSFGDPVFSNFLLIPLQQKYDSKYKKAVWTSEEDFLRVFPMPVSLVAIKLENFLDVTEQDEELLRLYLKNLSNGSARPSWCPFFYLVAVNHVSKFIFDVSDTQDYSEIRISNARLNLLAQVLQLNNEDAKKDIIMFETADRDAQKGFKTFQSLPTIRQIIIEKANEMKS